MPRPRPDDISAAGQDSFLDVVTNIVGILIILVMVVGGRVQKIVLEAVEGPRVEVESLATEVNELAATVGSAEHEIDELQLQSRVLEASVSGAADARLQLATAVSAAKAGLEERRRAGDAARVAAIEAAAKRVQLEEEVTRLEREAEALAHERPTTEEVLAYPTPIGRTVNGEEMHFRIAGGRIAYIPLEELFQLAKNRTQRFSGSVAEMASHIETVGPEQEFWLDYVIETRIDQSRGQILVRSREWLVRPTGPLVGEPVEDALLASSRFRRTLAGVKPETTVTLWCYPDSFGEYRRVREELHRLGVPTAGRPLPEGAPIGGSSDGSKSVVQ